MIVPSRFALWNVLFILIGVLPFTAYLLWPGPWVAVLVYSVGVVMSVSLGLVIHFFGDHIIYMARTGFKTLWTRKTI